MPRLHDTTGLTRLYNRFDNRVERTATVRSTSCQTGLCNRFDNRLYTRYSRLSNQFHKYFLYHVNGALVCLANRSLT